MLLHPQPTAVCRSAHRPPAIPDNDRRELTDELEGLSSQGYVLDLDAMGAWVLLAFDLSTGGCPPLLHRTGCMSFVAGYGAAPGSLGWAGGRVLLVAACWAVCRREFA